MTGDAAMSDPDAAHVSTLSAEAAAVVAGLVDFDVNAAGIVTTLAVWREIHAAFPIALFHAWVDRHGTSRRDGHYYDPHRDS